MRSYFVRAVPFALLVVLAACSGEAGSSHLKGLEKGMGRAEAVASMGTGPLSSTFSDSARLVNGFRHMRYLIDGKQFEIIYARDEPGDVKELVSKELETPVVLMDDKVLGWGWRFYGEAMKEYKLPTPLIDTTSLSPKRDTTRGAPPSATPKPPAPPTDTGKKA
jgi:hypothetical protein